VSEHEAFDKWLKDQESGASSREIWRAAQKATIDAIMRALAPIAARQKNLAGSVAVSDCIQAIERVGKGE
jgi:sensor histidine kinase regulating citrate/malate metabolism